MQRLIALKPIRLSGQLVLPGQMFQTAKSPEVLINNGYARELTDEEMPPILGYVEEARQLFGQEQERTVEPSIIEQCRCCKGTDFWTSIHDVRICRICHPPVRPEVERQLPELTGRDRQVNNG